MNNDHIRNAYDAISPSELAKARMLRNITAAAPTAHKARTARPKLLLVAAVVAAMFALAATAYAADWFGLRDAFLMTKPETTQSGLAAGDYISLQGTENSPEWQAAAEWQSFLQCYDSDGSILASLGNKPTGFEEKYNAYICYTQEMADEIDRICEKYSLKLLEGFTEPATEDEFFSLAGTGVIYAPSGNNFVNTVNQGFVYADGSFRFDGQVAITGTDLKKPIDYQFIRNMKDSFSTALLNVGSIDDYTQWQHTTPNGVELLMCTSENKQLIIADLGKSYVVVNLLRTPGDTDSTPLSRETMEAFADIFDFSVIP